MVEGFIYMNKMKYYFTSLIILALISCLIPEIGFAASLPSSIPLDTCSNNPGGFFDYTISGQASVMLQNIVADIYADVSVVSGRLFSAFVSPLAAFFGIGTYMTAVGGLMTLSVIFFAISIMFGFVTLTGWQVITLLIKLAFIVWLTSPTAAILAQVQPTAVTYDGAGNVLTSNMNTALLLGSIQHLLYAFFIDIPNEIIEVMINIGRGTPTAPLTGSISAPFALLDNIIQVVFSPRMIVTIIASFGAGPYGPMMAAALGYAIFQLFMSLLKATQIFILALVIKSILIGLSPVFFPMMLFTRTKVLFNGWINQLVNFSMQPILLFAFLAFFANLVASAARDLLPADDVHVCYVKSGKQGATPFDVHSWRYMCCTGGTCQPYEGKFESDGYVTCPGGPVFPLNHIDLIVFLLLTHIMKQLSSVAVVIAAELSQGLMRLNDIDSSVNKWFSGAGSASKTSTTTRAKK
jgi:TrbL/VirB6 plasmid conjugal transfer protein